MTEVVGISPPAEVENYKNTHRWADNLPELQPQAKKLLQEYAKIPADEVGSHVMKIREQAFAVHPYPCIGQFRFLDLGLYASHAHDEVISRIKNGQNYLDLGCCFGQEVRYLASQGCPTKNLYAADLRPVFIEYGYELFRDKDSLEATFLTPADIFAKEPLNQLNGKIDIVNAMSFFHLFSWDDSIRVAKRVVEFLRAEKGSLVVGRQVGRVGEAAPKDGDSNSSFRHNAESWKRMWDQVGQATNSQWDVEFWWDKTRQGRAIGSHHSNPEDDNIQRFCFIVRRL